LTGALSKFNAQLPTCYQHLKSSGKIWQIFASVHVLWQFFLLFCATSSTCTFIACQFSQSGFLDKLVFIMEATVTPDL